MTGAARGVADTTSLARHQWVQGPNLDVSTAVDMRQRRAFRAGDVDIESEDGWIRVYGHDGARVRAPHIVGPGIALTATANGQFIVAIAPDPQPSRTSRQTPSWCTTFSSDDMRNAIRRNRRFNAGDRRGRRVLPNDYVDDQGAGQRAIAVSTRH